MNRVITELNELSPDAVVCTGDLTTEGYRQEYKNWLAYAERIEAPMLHGARQPRLAQRRVPALRGPDRTADVDAPTSRASGSSGVDSSEPDLNEGKVGRDALRMDPPSSSQAPAALKVFVLHHHLLPIPGTGRERSTVMDAGDLLEVLIHAGRRRRALGPQARALRLAPREHVRRERRHGVVAARARVHEALLQRARVRRGRGARSCGASRSATSTVMAHFSLVGRAVPPGARAARPGAHRARRRLAPARAPARSSDRSRRR